MRMRVQPWGATLGRTAGLWGQTAVPSRGCGAEDAHTLARGLARKAPQLSRGAVPEVEQRTDEFLVVAPALNRTLIDLLPHLPEAGCRHGSDSLVEIQAPLIPWEPDKIQNPACPLLLIRDQFLVRHDQQRFRRQHTAPVRDQ